MLTKLMKYDIKNMMKILVYIYVVAIGLSIVTRIINIWSNIQVVAIIGGVFAGLTYAAVGNVIVNTFVHIIRVFLTSFYKDESYLTHTLPIDKSKLMLSKYLSGLVVILCSVLVSFMSLMIVLYSPEFMDMIKVMIEMTVSGFDMDVTVFILLVVFILFAEICAMMSMSFLAIVKGNTYNTKRILRGLLWFAVYYMLSIVVTILLALVVFAVQGDISMILSETLSYSAFVSILVVGVVVYILAAVVYYILANRLFHKGVNVD